MNLNDLPPTLLTDVVRLVLAGVPADRPSELPCFINGHGPYLARINPARLLLLPPRTAWALARAWASPRVQWPAYQPAQHWALKATCDALYNPKIQDYYDGLQQEAQTSVH